MSPPRASFFSALVKGLSSAFTLPPGLPYLCLHHPHPTSVSIILSDVRRGSAVCFCRFYEKFCQLSVKSSHRSKGKVSSTAFYYFTRNTYLAPALMWYYKTNLIKLSSEHNLCPALIKKKTESSKPTERTTSWIQSNFNRPMDFDKDRKSNTIALKLVMSSITVVGKRLDFDSHSLGCTALNILPRSIGLTFSSYP